MVKKAFRFVKNFFRFIKVGFSDKLRYKVVDEALNGFSFDFGSLYDIEYAKLAEMKNYFEKYGVCTNNENIISKINLGMKLLRIISDDSKLFDYVDKEQNANFPICSEEWLANKKYVCNVNVNLKNSKRFAIDDKHNELLKKWPHALYEIKARYLYHKLRYYFEQYWWD